MTAITELKQLTATNQPPASRVAIMPPNVSKGKKKKKNCTDWYLEQNTGIKVSNPVGKSNNKYMVVFQGLR